MIVCGLTDIGKKRRLNQDVYLSTTAGHTALLVVCDGMGGVTSGEIAAEISANAFIETASNMINSGAGTSESMAQGAAEACRRVREDTIAHPERYGMGTTLTAAAINDGGLTTVANIGDSRAYHLGKHGIRRITEDHSYVAELVRHGAITEAVARIHPKRNLITRAVTGAEIIKPDIFNLTLSEGDHLLICSDGLHGVLSDNEIFDVISSGGSPESVCRDLIDKTLYRGAPDNVTVLICRFGHGPIEILKSEDGRKAVV